MTCLADLFRPEIGFAAVRLLELAGCEVSVPAQSCCGQPAYNAGDRKDAIALARNVIAAFEPYDYVIVPSGSCAGMLRVHYPALFESDPVWSPRAAALAAKTHELFSFLVNVRGLKSVEGEYAADAVYHDSCSSLRENGVMSEPRMLLKSVCGLKLRDFADKLGRAARLEFGDDEVVQGAPRGVAGARQRQDIVAQPANQRGHGVGQGHGGVRRGPGVPQLLTGAALAPPVRAFALCLLALQLG